MIPLELIDTAALPDGGTLRLMHRGEDYSILFGRNELMSSRLRGSEEALATLGCERLGGRARPRVLIGGLGMGFTLRAVLDVLPPAAVVVVAELLPAVIEWNRGPLAPLAAHPLRDPRVRVETADVGFTLRANCGQFDAILLDAPCSGTGTLRRRPDAKWRKSVENLLQLVELQAELLDAAAGCVREGGVLAYSTCSLEEEENAGAVRAFLDRHPGWSLAAPSARWVSIWDAVAGAADLPGALPMPVQVFVLWIAMAIWRASVAAGRATLATTAGQ